MKFNRAMKIVMRRRERAFDLTYPLIGARNAFTHYLHGLENFSDFSRLENVTGFRSGSESTGFMHYYRAQKLV